MKKINKYIRIFTPIILGIITGLLLKNRFSVYDSFNKPFLYPKSFLFPIVWTIIYLIMGYSYYIYNKENNKELKIYYIQLFLNISWSFIFFLFKLRLLACIWIIILDIVVIILLFKYFTHNKKLFYFNILYLLWILFATYLTIGIYVLN